MPRFSTLFAIAAVIALALGLLATRSRPSTGLTITLPATTYLVPDSMLYYGAAFFFCLFAFLYSIWMVPWSAQAAMWHF